MIFLLLRLGATILELALVAGAAVIFEAALTTARARLARRIAPRFAQPVDDLRKSWRKRRMIPEFSSPLAPIWPVLCLAATALAAAVVPGFFSDTLLRPLATAPMVIGLLILARAALVLGALDSGQGARGLSAALAARDMVVFIIALLLLGLGHGVITGSVALAAPATSNAVNAAARVLGLAGALGVLGLDRAGPDTDDSGPDRVFWAIAAMLRRVAVILFTFDALAPFGIADAGHPGTWLAGIAAFFGKLAVGFLLLLIGPALVALVARWRWTVPGALALVATSVMVPALAATSASFWLFVMPVTIWGAALLLWRRVNPLDSLMLAQIGVLAGAMLAGATDASIILLIGLVLARLAFALAPAGHRLGGFSLLALAGLPPFGLFAGDCLALRALGAESPGIAVFSGMALAVLACLLLARLRGFTPTGGRSRRGAVAFVLLTALAALGVAPLAVMALPHVFASLGAQP